MLVSPPRAAVLILFLIPPQALKLFFKKRLARLQVVRIIRGLGGDNPPRKLSPVRAAGLLFKNQIKTDVWALVGIVFTNYSDTTSDH